MYRVTGVFATSRRRGVVMWRERKKFTRRMYCEHLDKPITTGLMRDVTHTCVWRIKAYTQLRVARSLWQIRWLCRNSMASTTCIAMSTMSCVSSVYCSSPLWWHFCRNLKQGQCFVTLQSPQWLDNGLVDRVNHSSILRRIKSFVLFLCTYRTLLLFIICNNKCTYIY